jgi:ABC-type oligopeptide transport system substrate-binding subunit
MNWESKAFTKALEASFCARGKERELLLEQAEELLMEEMPVAPIYHGNMAYMVQPHSKLSINSIGELVFDRAVE